MTPQEQRIAIAEACIPHDLRFNIITRDEPEKWVWPSGKITGPPDESLDAMHEAEQWLYSNDFILYTSYIDELTNICSKAYRMSAYRESASADQRAEAFCRTLFPDRFPNHRSTPTQP